MISTYARHFHNNRIQKIKIFLKSNVVITTAYATLLKSFQQCSRLTKAFDYFTSLSNKIVKKCFKYMIGQQKNYAFTRCQFLKIYTSINANIQNAFTLKMLHWEKCQTLPKLFSKHCKLCFTFEI